MHPRHRSDGHEPRAARATPALAWCAAGVLSAAAVTASLTGAVSSFTASVRNEPNAATTGSVVLQETSDGVTCLSTGSGTSTDSGAATCSTINKYGSGLLVPGSTSTKDVVLTNRGTAAATSATLTADACTSAVAAGATYSGSGNLCSALVVTIATTGTGGQTVYSGAPSGLSGTLPLLPVPVAAGGTLTVRVTVALPSSTTNALQGLTASQPLTWTLAS